MKLSRKQRRILRRGKKKLLLDNFSYAIKDLFTNTNRYIPILELISDNKSITEEWTWKMDKNK